MEHNIPMELWQRCEKLTELIEGKGSCSIPNGTAQNLTVECLLDTFMVMYEECQHDNLARNKPVASFMKKCNFIF